MRLLSVASSELQHVKEEQDVFYKQKQRQEREETGHKTSCVHTRLQKQLEWNRGRQAVSAAGRLSERD